MTSNGFYICVEIEIIIRPNVKFLDFLLQRNNFKIVFFLNKFLKKKNLKKQKIQEFGIWRDYDFRGYVVLAKHIILKKKLSIENK